MLNNIVITAADGIFPGADNLSQFWENIKSATVAPLFSLCEQWRVDEKMVRGVFPSDGNSTYVTQAHLINDDLAMEGEDRQESIAKLLFKRLIAGDSDLDNTGVVFGTNWSCGAYFESDIDQALGNKHNSDICSQFRASPTDQLKNIVQGQIGGPVLAVDMACASSLYAVDTAIKTIKAGLAERMIVFGLNAYLPLFLFTGFSKLGALSPSLTIRPYLDDANGIVLGEAAAAIVIEKDVTARKKERKALARIKQVSLSADGADRSIFAPSLEGQNLLYSRSYSTISPGDIDYIEGHGTATDLCDETEISVIDQFFGTYFTQDKPLPMGSAKSITGHTLAAAGLVSIIKGILMLKHKILPPHIKGESHQKLKKCNIQLLNKPMHWVEPYARPRRMGISGLGFGGANAHVILEEYRPNEQEASCEIRYKNIDLAIFDISGTFGTSNNLRHIGINPKYLGENGGRYFSKNTYIDVEGLRMGPRFLKHIDPVQLLLTHHVHQLLNKSEKKEAHNRTGVVTVNNMGGNLALKLSRRTSYQFRSAKHAKDFDCLEDLGPNFTPKSIASCLPALMSGYPAFHFDCKAFHENISGGPLTFWQALVLSPQWLRHNADEIFLGAATSIKNAIEFESNKRGEAVIVFRIKPWEEANREDKPLAIVQQLVWKSEEISTFKQATKYLTLVSGSLLSHTIIDLDKPGHIGNLDEIQGLDDFVLLLTNVAIGKHSVEVRFNGCFVLLLVLEKLRAYENKINPPKQPFKLNFESSSFLSKCSKEADNNNISTIKKTTSIKEVESNPALEDANQESAQPIKKHDYMINKLPLYSQKLDNVEIFLKVVDAQKSAMIDFYRYQRLLSSMFNLTSAETNQDQYCYKYSKHHDVLSDFSNKMNYLNSKLRVDESHSYFFDHFLDHIPGTLLIAGFLQTLEKEINNIKCVNHSMLFISELTIKFSRWCEKKQTVEISIDSEQTLKYMNAEDSLDGIASVHQREKKCAGITWKAKAHYLKENSNLKNKIVDTADKKWLHKQFSENVFVTPLRKTKYKKKQVFCCTAIPASKGHYFSQGHRLWHSSLYIIEISRQMIMLYAHQVLNIPLGMPMILISVSVNFSLPPVRNNNLEISIKEEDVENMQIINNQLTKIKVTFKDQRGHIGQCSLTAQVVEKNIYQSQRNIHKDTTYSEI